MISTFLTKDVLTELFSKVTGQVLITTTQSLTVARVVAATKFHRHLYLKAQFLTRPSNFKLSKISKTFKPRFSKKLRKRLLINSRETSIMPKLK